MVNVLRSGGKISFYTPPLLPVTLTILHGDSERVKALINLVKLNTVIFTAEEGERLNPSSLQRPNIGFPRREFSQGLFIRIISRVSSKDRKRLLALCLPSCSGQSRSVKEGS